MVPRPQTQGQRRQLRPVRLGRSDPRHGHRLHAQHRGAGARQSGVQGQEDRQTVYTSQGDLFSIWGAKCKPDRPHPLGWERCLPSENRCKGEYEWNHYRVEANDGVLKLAVNGKVVSGVSECNPRKGYLALESEGSECRFKNLKIKELPSTNPKPEEICDVDPGLAGAVHRRRSDALEGQRRAQGPLEDERRRAQL